jgi:pyruvate kinase
VRIMVTMPSEAATDAVLVRELVKSGMDIMRINCAHDDANAWAGMIGNLRKAERALGLTCRVLMDLGGPKLRSGHIDGGSPVAHWAPRRTIRGLVAEPARVWLTRATRPRTPTPMPTVTLPVDDALIVRARVGDVIHLRDTRGSRRRLRIVRKTRHGCWAASTKSAYVEPGTTLDLRRDGESLLESRVGPLPTVEAPVVVKPGDTLRVTTAGQRGIPASYSADGELLRPASVPCTLPEVFTQVKPRERILFDDGKIRGVIRAVDGTDCLLRSHTPRLWEPSFAPTRESICRTAP